MRQQSKNTSGQIQRHQNTIEINSNYRWKLFKLPTILGMVYCIHYAMVVRHPYAKYPPVPIVEYIMSCHTTDSIRVMLRTLKEKEVYPNVSCYPTPAVVMIDFSMAIIKACIREFTNENVEDYLTRGFNIINGDASREDAEKTIFHVCAVHMLKLNKFHVKKLYGKGETGSSKVHIANVFLWSIVVLFNTLGDDKFCLPWLSHF